MENEEKKRTEASVAYMHRSCLRKKYYRTKEKALQYTEKFDKLFGRKNYIYYCPICLYYHITTHKKEGVKYLNE